MDTAQEILKKFHQADETKDPVKRLLALEDVRREIYMYENYKNDELRALIGRSELDPNHWGPLTWAIVAAEKQLRMPPKRSDWVKRSKVTNSEPARCLQDARSYIYSDSKFWKQDEQRAWARDSRRWDELAHKASVRATKSMKTATLEEAPSKSIKDVPAAKVTYSEWK